MVEMSEAVGSLSDATGGGGGGLWQPLGEYNNFFFFSHKGFNFSGPRYREYSVALLRQHYTLIGRYDMMDLGVPF